MNKINKTGIQARMIGSRLAIATKVAHRKWLGVLIDFKEMTAVKKDLYTPREAREFVELQSKPRGRQAREMDDTDEEIG